ncbi:DUF2971 domain-containing protein [Streptococcus salivarius]|uniref:DUF2971 domain-containing protein n=1 Tax=Streptococcus salivarius TaxID=1304 RepID=UPI001918D6B0|nr:DUF2971 domain-containing protein [Streptococcus salivarius]
MSSDSNQRFLKKIEKIEKEYLKNPDVEVIVNQYLITLGELAIKQKDEKFLKIIADKASDVYESHSELEEIANTYLLILKILAEKQENEQSLKETANKASAVYEAHLELVENAEEYIFILSELAFKQRKGKKFKETVDKMSAVYDDYSKSRKVSQYYIWVLSILATHQDDKKELKEIAFKASIIYESHSDIKEIAEHYIWILRCLASKQEDEKSLKDIVDKASTVYESHSKIKEIANTYLSILRFLAQKQEDEKSLKDTVAIATTIYNNQSGSEENSVIYLSILNCLVSEQEDEKDLISTVDKATTVYEESSKSEIEADTYLLILYGLALEQEDDKELTDTVDKATTVYEESSKSIGINFIYLWILYCLASNQDKEKDLEDTEKIANAIYNKQSKNEIFAVTYLKILYFLTLKQGEVKDLRQAVHKANSIYKEHTSSVDVINLYGRILVRLIRVENDIDILNSNLDKLEKLLKTPLEARADFVVGIISDTISNLNLKINQRHVGEKRQLKSRIYKMIEVSKNINSVRNINNGMLSTLLERYKSDNIGAELILNIYNLVLQIKFELAVKNFPKKGLGHYTSGKTLQIHLNQEENISKNEKYKITSRPRLYNVDYMNDPEEGKILDRYLSLQKENKIDNFLEPSPWFLMCLTTAIDDLAMWSQYGADAEGVFLELKSDSFQLVNSPGDIDWLSGNSKLVELENVLNEKYSFSEEETKGELDKDKLFRICYLDENELKRGKLVVSSEDVLLKKKERKTITLLLEKLKEKADEIVTVRNPQLFNDVDKLLEEVRYLFKASGYKYEKELRVLRYATIESTENELIRIQYDSNTLAKPYLNRKDPIQIKRVIFGPKFSRPEYVTPLIRLVDKNIEFTTSERKFK